MNEVKISTCGTIKLNSFRPLCWTELGLSAIEKYKLPPFIDASCRREPDFENPFPSISALCRQGQFAPHLQQNDIIAYITVGGDFKPHKQGHHLIAILQVEEVYGTHQIGQNEYKKANLPIPSNCMVEGNPPFDFDKTAGNFKTKSQQKTFIKRTEEQKLDIGKRLLKSWDEHYLEKSKKWECFVKTRPIYVNIHNPTQILNSDFEYIFGKIPNTRTPNKISKKQLIELAKLVGINIAFE
jgi:hypothetical protein